MKKIGKPVKVITLGAIGTGTGHLISMKTGGHPIPMIIGGVVALGAGLKFIK